MVLVVFLYVSLTSFHILRVIIIGYTIIHTLTTTSSSSMAHSTPTELNILTLNCWGLKYLATLRRERLIEIGRRIANASPTPEIVGLQECWTQEDYLAVRNLTKGILPYGKFYHSGIFGGGLAILSKWPIEESNMFRYPLNGRPTAFFRGDWFVGKGVASARIRIGNGEKDIVEVFTTHLHAPYEREPNDSYICHRTAQAWEIAKLMRGAAERGHLVVGLGDFNMIPQSLAHKLIQTHSTVKDVWAVLHPDSSIGAAIDDVEKARGRPIPTAEFNLRENGATCDSVLNTWRWSKEEQKKLGEGKPNIEIPLETSDPNAKRLDYVFANIGPNPYRPNGDAWEVKTVKVGMTERHPTLGCSLTDHFSVECTLTRIPFTPQQPLKENMRLNSTPTPNHTKSALNATSTIISSSSPRQALLPLSTYDEILAMITKYTARERFQRRFRLSNFLLSFFFSIGCWTAIWWSPRNYISFILIFLSSLGLAAGVIDGLIGGLFVGSEIRALKEFEWEIRNVRDRKERVEKGVTGGEGNFMEGREGVVDW